MAVTGGEQMLRWPIEPMRPTAAADLPLGRDLVYEPKWDGWRAVTHVGPDVDLRSRHGRRLNGYFPDVCKLLQLHLPPETILDGELVIWDLVRGRTDFGALQRRVAAGRRLALEAVQWPAHFVVFDVLADAGQDVSGLRFAERRVRLERLLDGAPTQLQLCPQTTDALEARAWMTDWAAVGVEGVVAKRADAPYGSATWQKVRVRQTVDAVVGGVTGSLSRPSSLLLGRYDERGRLRYVGSTHPVGVARHAEVAAALRPLVPNRRGAASRHPWPCPLPAGWASSFDRSLVEYRQVHPVVVVEVEADTAWDSRPGRWRHRTRYIRVRADLLPHDVMLRAS